MVFTEIDHASAASKNGLTLKPWVGETVARLQFRRLPLGCVYPRHGLADFAEAATLGSLPPHFAAATRYAKARSTSSFAVCDAIAATIAASSASSSAKPNSLTRTSR